MAHLSDHDAAISAFTMAGIRSTLQDRFIARHASDSVGCLLCSRREGIKIVRARSVVDRSSREVRFGGTRSGGQSPHD
jgi:hypothetical protein